MRPLLRKDSAPSRLLFCCVGGVGIFDCPTYDPRWCIRRSTNWCPVLESKKTHPGKTREPQEDSARERSEPTPDAKVNLARGSPWAGAPKTHFRGTHGHPIGNPNFSCFRSFHQAASSRGLVVRDLGARASTRL